jgi:NhaA family Na+:H+ antiporter
MSPVPDRESESWAELLGMRKQVAARSWQQTDRFVPARVVRPIQRLMQVETSSAVAILVATLLALVLANTGLHDAYERFWETRVALQVGGTELLGMSLREIVDDGLMTLFFLLVSLEIKREIVFGELRDPRAAALPIVAAVGGMVVPAMIYVAFNAGTPAVRGWGIPMATDIAFAVAVVTALGRRVPLGARLFLLTLAIVDDLGAILVIAIFYTDGLHLLWLLAALTTIAVALSLQRVRVRAATAYIALGAIGWFALHESGVHATLIGVAFGLITPAMALLPANLYPEVATGLVGQVVDRTEDGVVTADEHEANDHTLREIRRLTKETQSPLHRAETRLAPYVAFGIVPVFAFANAGIRFPDVPVADWATDPVVLGVALGLVVGKTLGIYSASWLTVRIGAARYPTGMTQTHLLGLAMTAGIGFTVALFIANLAFAEGPEAEVAKLGILLGSAVAALLGYLTLRLTSGTTTSENKEPT